MRTTITIPDKQAKKIDRIAEYLGVKRTQAITYLITQGISAEQFKIANVDTAEGTRLLAAMAEKDLREYEESLHVQVTHEELTKNETFTQDDDPLSPSLPLEKTS